MFRAKAMFNAGWKHILIAFIWYFKSSKGLENGFPNPTGG
jgi:hypothetical protein